MAVLNPELQQPGANRPRNVSSNNSLRGLLALSSPTFSLEKLRKTREFRPVGSFDNSPAIHRWGRGPTKSIIRPVGTVEPWWSIFGCPYGTCGGNKGASSRPSSKLLGYCRLSLRDKNVGKIKAVSPRLLSTTRLPRVSKYCPPERFQPIFIAIAAPLKISPANGSITSL